METFIKIVQLFLSLSLLVAIHEFGHFIVARLFKIRVEKFYIFFDPWFSLFKFKKGDTEYGIGWVPFGGYVKIAGMIDESLDTEQMKQPAKEDEFRSKPAWQRFLVLVAGVAMNVLLALVIYCGISYAWGSTYLANDDVKWGYTFNETAHKMGFSDGDKIISIDGRSIDNANEILNALVISDSDKQVTVCRNGSQVEFTIPFDLLLDMRNNEQYADLYAPRIPMCVGEVVSESAAEAGLRKGDIITAVNGETSYSAQTIFELIGRCAGNDALLTVERPDSTFTLTAHVNDEGKIGFLVDSALPLRTQKYTLLQSIPAGAKLTGRVISNYWQQLKMIAKPKTQMYKSLGGFIAIGNIFPSEWNWQQFWYLTGFFSIILAIMNLLPIPGLDGGHALFTLWEMITRRKPSDKFLEIAQYIGVAIILLLLLYANGNDIYRFFIK
ncbi:MAG: RIP metalloprotease RseP [Alistipes sp.]|nr:RIP metalloprotease RseP [Alistipes sp.]